LAPLASELGFGFLVFILPLCTGDVALVPHKSSDKSDGPIFCIRRLLVAGRRKMPIFAILNLYISGWV